MIRPTRPTVAAISWRSTLFMASAATAACIADGAPSPSANTNAEAPTVIARRQDEQVTFEWIWNGEVDAFNAVLGRDGVSEPQIELPRATRRIEVEARGATLVTLSVQACNKGVLKSNCTAWSTGESHR